MTMIKQKCDFCENLAIYDGKTKMGPWAFMCEEHYKLYGIPGVEGMTTRLEEKKRFLTKTCCVCNKEKSLDDFYKYKDNRGVERYRGECAACNLEAKKRHSFGKR